MSDVEVDCAGGSLQDEREMTVLFVEDDEMILRLLRRMCEQLPCSTVFASNAETALMVCAESPIDVVMSDFSMPGGSGLALLSTIAVRWPSTLRVLVTGYPRSFFDGASLHGVVDHMVLKPWRSNELREVIAGLIEQAHARAVR